MHDQAERLRLLAQTYKREILGGGLMPTNRTQVLAVTSGKGGVGKTNLSVSLAYALQARGHDVMVLDADLGLSNVDVLLGTCPTRHLGHAIAGDCDVLDVVYAAPGGLKLIAGGSGIEDLVDLPHGELQRFIHSLRRLDGEAEYLIIDTGAGLGRSVTQFVLAADIVVIVTTPEPTAMTDAYALVKAVVRQNPAADLRLIVNQAESRLEAEEAAHRLMKAALQFLGASIELLGIVPRDTEIPRSVRAQESFLHRAPHSAAAQAVMEMADRLGGHDVDGVSRFSLFFDRLSKAVNRWR